MEEAKINLQSLEDKLISLAEQQCFNIINGYVDYELDRNIDVTKSKLMNATVSFCDKTKFITFRREE